MVGLGHLLLALLEQALEALDALVAGDELALGDGHLLLEGRVLLDELALHLRQLLEVALEERHLLLLRAVVAAAQHVVVLLARLVERDLELHHALAAVLQVAHQALLHDVELGQLLLHRLAVGHGHRPVGLDAPLQVVHQRLELLVLRRPHREVRLEALDQLDMRARLVRERLGEHGLDLLLVGLVQVAGQDVLVLELERLQPGLELRALARLRLVGRRAEGRQLGLPHEALRLHQLLPQRLQVVRRDRVAGGADVVQGIEVRDRVRNGPFVVAEHVSAEVEAGHHLGHLLGLLFLLFVQHRARLLGAHLHVEHLLLDLVQLRRELRVGILQAVHGDLRLLVLECKPLQLHLEFVRLADEPLVVLSDPAVVLLQAGQLLLGLPQLPLHGGRQRLLLGELVLELVFPAQELLPLVLVQRQAWSPRPLGHAWRLGPRPVMQQPGRR